MSPTRTWELSPTVSVDSASRWSTWEDDIYVPAQETYQIESFIDGSIMTIADAPWPGLTPDLLSVLLVVATQAKGSVLIHQKMSKPLFFVDKLIDMGAQIILCDRTAPLSSVTTTALNYVAAT